MHNDYITGSCIMFIGVFYYTLANICPIFRSSLQVIQLVCVARSVDIKTYGCDGLLKPSLDQVNCLVKL